MNTTKRITKWRMVAFILLCLVPLATFFVGAMAIIGGMLLNMRAALLYVVLPACAISLFALIIFSRKRTFIKVILIIPLAILLIFMSLFVSFWGNYEELLHYKGDEIASYYTEGKVMPSLSEIGEPVKTDYYEYLSVFGIFFDTEVKTLICKYDEDSYTLQKASLDTRHTFEENSLSADGYACEPTLEIDGYVFRTLDVEEYDFYYPKYLGFIATNDETNEIVYMYSDDDDLDYITLLPDFIVEDCGWKYIR